MPLNKKPTLNQDILEEIFPIFLDYPFKTEDIFGKFMISGKEPCEAVLRHFSQVDVVFVTPDSLIIRVKRHALGYKKASFRNDGYRLPYDSPILDKILRVLENHNQKLGFKDFPECAAGRKALARLMRKDLNFVAFDYGNNYPADYYKFLKNECSFDDARLNACDVKNPKLSEFFELSSKHYTVTSNIDVIFLKLRNEKRTFPVVEALTCNQDTTTTAGLYSRTSFTSNALRNFTKLLVTRLPNLKKLLVKFRFAPWREPEEICEEMKKFNLETFKHIPVQIKGVIFLYVYHDIFDHRRPMTEYLQNSVDVKFDEDENSLTKKFDIHDGLTFKFVLQLSTFNFSEEGTDMEEIFENENNYYMPSYCVM